MLLSPETHHTYFVNSGREFAIRVDPSGETMVTFCSSNGNMYPVRTDDADCSKLRATVDDGFVYDGALDAL
ncbi:uncharacterized protein GLRG_08545 [Colletotrichum graminicola M1.001]|uniref:Uncharacterized protein n=1 Tax=Colletotrichum graminicola (strain M1.001 / M2 / FGSC 10212) TaxID=645133 RepID=E3QRX8_COLGM|nr:uncharacterized protein GLRG_08545 [Colletotrichum graminicola M1.001]EFQ33616.1 hypothetical protein GLRG_08545 [Colletotrichum graminicola M1.001]